MNYSGKERQKGTGLKNGTNQRWDLRCVSPPKNRIRRIIPADHLYTTYASDAKNTAYRINP